MHKIWIKLDRENSYIIMKKFVGSGIQMKPKLSEKAL